MRRNKKHPELQSAQGESKDPWFHLNLDRSSTLFACNGADPAGHFLPAAPGRHSHPRLLYLARISRFSPPVKKKEKQVERKGIKSAKASQISRRARHKDIESYFAAACTPRALAIVAALSSQTKAGVRGKIQRSACKCASKASAPSRLQAPSKEMTRPFPLQ